MLSSGKRASFSEKDSATSARRSAAEQLPGTASEFGLGHAPLSDSDEGSVEWEGVHVLGGNAVQLWKTRTEATAVRLLPSR